MKTKLQKIINKTPYWYRALSRVTPSSGALINEMLQKSSRWQTCACGKQSSAIPRYTKNFADHTSIFQKGEPKDKKLSELGMEFHRQIEHLLYTSDDEAIFDKNRKEAIDIMNEIEKRAAIVLAERLAKKKKKHECLN